MPGSTGQKYKVVVCRDLGPDVMPLLTSRDDLEVVVWPEDRPCERGWLLENIPNASGVIVVLGEKANKELFDAAGPNLRVVSTMSVGYDHINLADVALRGLRVGYTPNVLTDAVADVSIMLALMATRNAGETYSLVKAGEWPKFSWSPFGFCGPQLSSSNRTVGFLGFGRISQATLARLIPFGITDCIYSSNPKSPPSSSAERDEVLLKSHAPALKSLRRVDLDELARESDVLFILAPGGAGTKHLINEDFLKKMKKHSVVVNAARGTLVDSNALAKALREKWIWAAGVDVVEGEPNVDAEHPLVKEPRCIVLPHIGSATIETRIGMATLAVKNVLAGISGEELPAELDVQGLV